MASQITAISQKLSSFHQAQLFYRSKYVNTNTSFLCNTSLNIVTGAKESKFKSMRFRNYCKFFCTSGSVYLRAHEGRARPWGPGNDDGIQ